MSKFQSALQDLFTVPKISEDKKSSSTTSTMLIKSTTSTMLTNPQKKKTTQSVLRRRTFYIDEDLYVQAEILMQIRGEGISEFINSILAKEISEHKSDIEEANKFFQNKRKGEP